MFNKIITVTDIYITQTRIKQGINAICEYIKNEVAKQLTGKIIDNTDFYQEIIGVSEVTPYEYKLNSDVNNMFCATLEINKIYLTDNVEDNKKEYIEYPSSMQITVKIIDCELSITKFKTVNRKWMLDVMKRYNAHSKYIKAFEERTA